jgi:hypothetical protein
LKIIRLFETTNQLLLLLFGSFSKSKLVEYFAGYIYIYSRSQTWLDPDQNGGY